MKDALLTVLATVLSVIVVGFGLYLLKYYWESESSIGNFIVGAIGFFVAVNPAMDAWESTFKKLFKIKDEE